MNLKKKSWFLRRLFLLHLAQKTYSVKPCSITSAKFPSNTDVKRVVLQPLTVPCPRKRVCLIWLGGLIRPVLIYRHRRATDCGVQRLPYQICVVSFICCLSRWQYSVTNVYPQTMNELFIKRKKNTSNTVMMMIIVICPASIDPIGSFMYQCWWGSPLLEWKKKAYREQSCASHRCYSSKCCHIETY